VLFLLMQRVPTVLVVLLLCWFPNRFEVIRLSFALIIVFLCLHTLGALSVFLHTVR